MRWIMRKEFEIAYEKANEILKRINYSSKAMIRTAAIMDAVEDALEIDIRFTDYDFKKINLDKKNLDVSKYGAAMCVFEDNGEKRAAILINEDETPKMKRFSLVHELGHLMTQPLSSFKDCQVSTHIDMDITSIPDEALDSTDNKFLLDEQIANIFALLVLLPFEILVDVVKDSNSIEEVADFFGVEKNAVISRLLLEDAQKVINA